MANSLEEKALDPSSTSMAYDYMSPKWNMIRSLLGGTRSMHAAGEKYLPRHTKETPVNYKNRLDSTILVNFTELSLDSLVGKPFSDPILYDEKVPKEVKDMLEDIDLQGSNMHTFARTWFREGLGMGMCHVLIDMPRPTVPANGAQRTAADDEREKLRPYWTLIKAENLIFAHSTTINGVEVLTHIRIYEEIVEKIGFTETVVKQIRVLEPGRYDLYRYIASPRNKKKFEWRWVDGGEIDMPVIPLVTFYSNREGFMCSKPPLEDLARINVRHWQSTSDQINILTVARFPMLAVSGAHNQGAAGNDAMEIGPRNLLSTTNENGKFYYVEHKGEAIKSGNEDLERLEQYMASYGAEFLRKKPGAQTATARALDSAEATSPLQDMTMRFVDALNTALAFTAEWLGLPESGSVKMTVDFGPDEVLDVDLRTLSEARRNRDVSRQAYLEELKRRGMLSDEFSFTENLDQLESEPFIESPFATGKNVDGSGGANAGNIEPDPRLKQGTTPQDKDKMKKAAKNADEKLNTKNKSGNA